MGLTEYERGLNRLRPSEVARKRGKHEPNRLCVTSGGSWPAHVRINKEKGDDKVANVKAGADALSALNQSDESGSGMEFTSFKSGSEFVVKALGAEDLISFASYGIFKKVNSFVAKNPSKKSAKGYPVEDLTPWDKAWKYHADLSEKFQDDHSQEAYKYMPKQRFAFGFFDLNAGEPIIIDLSRKQAQAIHKSITDNKDKLGRLSFKLVKEGTGTDTTVSLTPYVDVEMVDKLRQAEIDVEEDLTEEQRKNFDEAPEEFDMSLFDGILFEADEDEQIENLIQAGFDISLIGLEAPAKKEEGGSNPFPQDGEPIDIDEGDLPF